MTPLDVFVTTYLPGTLTPEQLLQRMGMASTTLGYWLAEQAAGRVRLTVVGAECPDSDHIYELLKHVQRVTGAAPTDWTAPLDQPRYRYIQIDAEGSQRQRHLQAAKRATSDLYIVADDDCVPWADIVPWKIPDEPETVYEHIARVFAERPHLSMASAYPMPSTLKDPMQAGNVERDTDCWYVFSTGGVRVVRRGAVVPGELPPMRPQYGRGYDGILCEHLHGGRGMHREQPRVAYFRRWCCNHLGYRASVVWPGSHALHREGA